MISSYEASILQAFYDYNRIPLWILDDGMRITSCFSSGIFHQLQEHLSEHIMTLAKQSMALDFDILYHAKELYYIFSFERMEKHYYLLGGPMLLSDCSAVGEQHNLSFSSHIPQKQLRTLVDNLPLISFSSFYSCLRIVMLLLKSSSPTLEEISNYKCSALQSSMERILIHEVFDNKENYNIHTPYRHEVAVLSCIRDGDLERLEATYRTLPPTRYGNMSNNPLRQLFYGSIANVTLITRYAIEGGLEEETAFTLSDIYIKQLESCKTLYELNALNETMAIDFTERVAKVRAEQKPIYTKPIQQCVDYIYKNSHSKITLESLAKEVNLTPKYLSSLFSKETGTTLGGFIEEKRISEAKNLLVYSQYSYIEISQYLSFCSQSHFISIFKKNTGMTPKRFREKYSRSNW